MHKQIRSIIVQWILPLAVLLIVVAIMIADFSVDNEKRAREQIEKVLIDKAQKCGIAVKNVLESIHNIQKPLAVILTEGEGSSAVVQKTVDAMVAEGEIYLAAYCYKDGRAIVSNQGKMNLIQTDYYSELDDTDFFMYTTNDGITGSEALLIVCPVKDNRGVKGYLISYYHPDMLNQYILNDQLDSQVFYLLADSLGKIYGTYGEYKETALLNRTQFWEEIERCISKEDKRKLDKLLKGDLKSGIFYVAASDERQVLAYTSLENSDLYWILGIDTGAMEGLANQISSKNVAILLKLAAAICIFLIIFVIIHIIGKIRANRQSRELEDKVDIDLLTGLNNKLATERKIKEFIQKFPNEQALMLLFDVDNFKKINDTMGHAFGDEVLRTLGGRISAEFRMSDILGRIGGDEFMILQKGIKDEMLMQKEKQKMERIFNNFQAGEYTKYSVTASIGAALFPRDADNFEDLYKAADKALYIAKKRGKNQLAFYKEEEN